MSEPLRVLIVEDNADDALLVERELRKTWPALESARVQTEPTFREALDRQSWDVIIADYAMPHFNGLAALAILKTTGLDIPFIIVSGTIGEEIAVQGMKAGAHDYLLKGQLGRLVPAAERELREAAERRNRRRAEQSLRESEQRQKLHFAQTPLIVVEWNLDFEVVAWNPAAERVFGYPALDALGRHASFIIPTAARAQVEEVWRQLLTGQGGRRSTNQNLTKDGRVILCEWYYTPLTNEGGHIVGVASLAQDVTERKQAEEALRRSEQRYRSIFENIQDIYFETSLEGRVIEVSPSVTRVAGYQREDILGRPVSDLYAHVAERHRLLDYLRRHGEISDYEVLLRDKSGQFRHTSITAQLLTDDNGRPWKVCGVIRDITSRKRIEEALRESEDRFRRTFEQAAVGIAHVALEGRFLRINQRFCDMLGYSREEMLGFTFQDITHPDDLQADLRQVEALLAGSIQTYSMEKRYRRKDHSFVWGNLTASFVRDPSGKARYFLSMVQDISERKQAEETRSRLEAQLRQAQKMEAVGTLAGGIAHDFNNMLTAILGHAELARLEGQHVPRIRQEIDDVVSAANRAKDLVQQILTFSRRQVLQPAALDLNQIVANLAKMLQRLIGEHIILQCQTDRKPGIIHADAGMIEQVLVNLAVNARDAMPSGGTLTITTRPITLDAATARANPPARPGDFIVLEVKDTGCGIPPEHLPRVFEPFFTTKEVGKGTGLGLATVFAIIQQHKGWIEVESEPRRGTTVRIYLPRLAQAVPDQAPAPVNPRPPRGSEAVLVVEDEPSVRALARTILQRHGYEVFEADGSPAAFQVWQSHGQKIKLLITDIVMPGEVSGKELAERLVTQAPSLRVVLTSGYSTEVLGHDFAARKGFGFLPKPYTPTALLQIVREHLDGELKERSPA